MRKVTITIEIEFDGPRGAGARGRTSLSTGGDVIKAYEMGQAVGHALAAMPKLSARFNEAYDAGPHAGAGQAYRLGLTEATAKPFDHDVERITEVDPPDEAPEI
jgi:hypothetical protein